MRLQSGREALNEDVTDVILTFIYQGPSMLDTLVINVYGLTLLLLQVEECVNSSSPA